MGGVGRNDPCSCGSGQKYKRFCLLKEAAALTSARQRLHDVDGRLLHDVGRWAAARFGADFDAAFDDYPQDVGKDALHIQLFVPWSCCHFRVHGRPAIDWYLETYG